MKIGSLCSGIGGLELGLEWAGLGPVIWQAENNAYCLQVLEKHWPNVKRYKDVREVDGTAEKPDLICGGFPCQDLSSAGKGAGLTGTRSSLWFEFYRVIHEIEPEWVIVENVASGAGRWVDAVRGALELIGYETLPIPLSAQDVGAPHIRKRVFIVGRAVYTWSKRRWRSGGAFTVPDTQRLALRDKSKWRPRRRAQRVQREREALPVHDGGQGPMADADQERRERRTGSRQVLSGRRQLKNCGKEVADDKGDGCGQGRAWGFDTGGSRQSQSSFQKMADADSEQEVRPSKSWNERDPWRFEPPICRVVNEFSQRLDQLALEGWCYAYAAKTRSKKALCTLWQSAAAQKNQWQAGGSGSLLTPSVLQPFVYGTRLYQGGCESCGSTKAGGCVSGKGLRGVRNTEPLRGTSQGLQSYEQRGWKPDDIMRFLSYEMALEARQSSLEVTGCLQGLREAFKEIGYVFETLSEVQEVWQSSSHEEKEWVCLRLSARDPWCVEWPGVSRTAQEVSRRTHRLRALGNSVVPQCAEVIGHVVLELERIFKNA